MNKENTKKARKILIDLVTASCQALDALNEIDDDCPEANAIRDSLDFMTKPLSVHEKQIASRHSVDVAFPSNKTEEILCGLTMDFIKHRPGCTGTNCVHFLLIASHRINTCFVNESSRKDFEKCIFKHFPLGVDVPWYEIKNLLYLRKALAVGDPGMPATQPIQIGDEWSNVRKSYPKIQEKYLHYCLAAFDAFIAVKNNEQLGTSIARRLGKERI